MRAISVLIAVLGCAQWPGNAADKNGVAPSAISLPKGPGSIEGLGESFQPTLNTGTAKYAIPLSVPPGPASHHPALQLSYEGGSGNGILGYGWSLPLPMVQRRTDKGIPLYGEDLGLEREDRFINESKEELVPTADGFFFCENEGAFVRYRQVDNHWEGTQPDGTKLEFGLSDEGRIRDATTGRVFGWLLERETDTRGNTIEYAYQSFSGDQNRNHPFLTHVSYGPGQPPWAAFHFITFEYEDRPDWFEDCRSGFEVRCGRRLAQIVVGTQGATLSGHLEGDWNGDGLPDFLNRQYELEYDGSGAGHWSLLSSVRVVGSDGVSRLPPTVLGYAGCEPPNLLSAEGRILGGFNEPLAVMDSAFVELVDLNGDGLPDLLQTFAGGLPHRAFLNLGFSQPAGALVWEFAQEVGGDGRAWNVDLQSNLGVAHLADMNGDGLADLVVKSVTDDVFYFANEGRLSWGNRAVMSVADVSPPSPFGAPGVRSADLDFDKGLDVIQSLDVGGGVAYRIWFNLGDQRYAPSLTVEPQGAFDLTDPAVQIADFNGDRVPDLIRLRGEQIEVKAGLGYGRFMDTRTVELPDLTLTTEQIQKAKWTDLTGDGIDDLVLEQAAPGQLWYWVNLGNYQLTARKAIQHMPLVSGQSAVVRWADMNGNGTTDLVYADASSNPRLQTVDLGEIINCGTTPHLLTSIANGLGRTITIEYRSSVAFRLEDEALGNPWSGNMPISVPVVSAVRVDDSLGHQYLVTFRYHDGYYDPREKQFRGFARVEQIEHGDSTAPTLITRSHFDTGRVYEAMKGKLLRLTSEQEDGGVFTDETSTWTEPPIILKTGTDGGFVSFVHPRSRLKHLVEGGEGEPRTLETEFEYDAYGNLTREADYGVVEGDDRSVFDDERVRITDFAINLERWMVRFPARQEIRDEHDVVISRVASYYDDETFSGSTPELLTIGNLTMKRDWIAPADPDAYIDTIRTRHDRHGNPVLILDPLGLVQAGEIDRTAGHFRELDYDTNLLTYPIRETIHVGGGSEPLVFEADYDSGFGTLTASSDFNRHRTEYGYDAFARLSRVVRPGDSGEFPTLEYEYALAVPVGATGLVNYVETRMLDRLPGTAGNNRSDHHIVSRQFVDGLSRVLMTKQEAEPAFDAGPARVVVQQGMTFNARQKPFRVLNSHFSLIPGASLEALLEFEEFEAANWKGAFHENGVQVELDLAQAHQTQTLYDAMLRSVAVVNPDGSIRRTDYEPLVTRVSDENDTVEDSPHFETPLIFHRDGLERLIRVDEIARQDDVGNPTDQAVTWTTQYQYDLNDQLTRIVDAQLNEKIMEYDGLKRMIRSRDADRGEWIQIFDAASNRIETRDAKGQRIVYRYDGVNRLLSEDFLDDASPEFSYQRSPDVVYRYDVPHPAVPLADRTTATAVNTAGNLAWVEDASGEEHTSYDERGRVDYVIKRVAEPWLNGAGQATAERSLVSYRTGYHYDALDRVTGLVYPDDDEVAYQYNARSLVSRIHGLPDADVLARIGYLASAQIEASEQGNGTATTHQYDSRLRTSRLLTRSPGAVGAGEGDLLHFTYEFDAASNPTLIKDDRPVAVLPDGDRHRNTQFLEYDSQYRLTRVQYSFAPPGEPIRSDGVITAGYDRVGNLLAQSSDVVAPNNEGFHRLALGEMTTGGQLGSWGRVGRSSDDPPGPHALTSIQNPQFDDRLLHYDGNGNLSEYDGWHCTWDFKDRLVGVENDNIRAEYLYDFSDRRIVKSVQTKLVPPTAEPELPDRSVTLYLNKHFEVRDDETPVKFVWNGDTRVARVSGPMGNVPLVQRLRLFAGWNLIGLGISASGGLASAGAETVDELRAFLWSASEGGFIEIDHDLPLPPGAVLWIHATNPGVWALKGLVRPDATIPTIELPPQGGFYFAPGFGPWKSAIESGSGAGLFTWWYDPAAQSWKFDGDRPIGSERSASGRDWRPGHVGFFRGLPGQQLRVRPVASAWEYYHQDHLGSTGALTDEKGRLTGGTAYFPFGGARETMTTVFPSEPYQFAQKESDAESGLQNFEARYLGPGWGRFLSTDPMALSVPTEWLLNPQKLNPYTYCENNPFKFRDEDGQEARVTIHGNNRITIEVAINYQGSHATRANIERANRGIQQRWSGKFGKYTVVTKVVNGDSTLKAATVTLTDKDNRGKYLRSYVDHESVADSGRWNPKDADFNWVAAHESGHLLGLPDRYTDKDGPMKGWRGNMMAQRGGKVEQRNIDEMLNGDYKFRKVKDVEREKNAEALEKDMRLQMDAWRSQDLKFDK